MTAEEKKKHRQEQIKRMEMLKKMIPSLHEDGYTTEQIAKWAGVNESTVRAILSNK